MIKWNNENLECDEDRFESFMPEFTSGFFTCVYLVALMQIFWFLLVLIDVLDTLFLNVPDRVVVN